MKEETQVLIAIPFVYPPCDLTLSIALERREKKENVIPANQNTHSHFYN